MTDQTRAGERKLTLDRVPDSLLLEFGFRPGHGAALTFACSDSQAVLIPVAQLQGPIHRKLSEPSLRRLLVALRDQIPLQAIPIVRSPLTGQLDLLDGMHRWRLS